MEDAPDAQVHLHLQKRQVVGVFVEIDPVGRRDYGTPADARQERGEPVRVVVAMTLALAAGSDIPPEPDEIVIY